MEKVEKPASAGPAQLQMAEVDSSTMSSPEFDHDVRSVIIDRETFLGAYDATPIFCNYDAGCGSSVKEPDG